MRKIREAMDSIRYLVGKQASYGVPHSRWLLVSGMLERPVGEQVEVQVRWVVGSELESNIYQCEEDE